MKLRTEHVKAGKQIKVPDGWKEIHTVLIEPKDKKAPYFAVLMKEEEEVPKNHVGFKV